MSDQPGAVARRAAADADSRTAFYKRIDEKVMSMVNSFRDILDAAQVQDGASNATAEYQTEVEAANMAQTCEGFLRLISDVKIATIVQDIEGSIQDMKEKTGPAYKDIVDSAEEALNYLGNEVNSTLAELERHYNNSVSLLPIKSSNALEAEDEHIDK